jgi:glycosyltransferase involved in cell wall biosynthesis
MNPKISVLIPAYNAEKTILAAVWSALNQAFDGFEVCVYNDGSTDNTQQFLDGIDDARLRLFHGEKNQGIVQTRNLLAQNTTAPFVAWLDADDVMLPGRLQAQYDYFHKHPETDILGGYAELRKVALKDVLMPAGSVVKGPTNVDYLRTAMLFRNPFIHSSIMVRNFFVKENFLFDPEFEYTEDYDWFLRCRQAGKQFGVVSRPVVSYLISSDTDQKNKETRNNTQAKWEKLLLRNFPFTGKENVGRVVGFLRNNDRLPAETFVYLVDWLNRAERLCFAEETKTTGTIAALLFQRFRLYRLRFGLLPAVIRLLFQNPFATVTMLGNRTRIV